MSIVKMQDLSKKIQKAMIDAEIDTDQLAKLCGVSRSTIYRIEKGITKRASAELLDKIKKVLNLQGGDDDLSSDTLYKLISDYKKDLRDAQEEVFNYKLKLELIQKELIEHKTELESAQKELKKLRTKLEQPLKKLKKA